MDYILLTVITAGVALQDIIKKLYNTKAGGSIFGFNIGFTVVCALVYLILGGFNVSICRESLLYALPFGLAFGGAVICGILMVNNGPLSLSTLIVSYSLLIPIFAGVLFMGETLKLITVIGIGLLAVSILVLNLKPKGAKEEGVRITKKWVLCAIGCFLCNGTGSSIQKLFIHFTDGTERYGMSFWAMIVGIALFAVCFLFSKKEQNLSLQIKALPYMGINGLVNAVSNTLVMVLNETMPGFILYPVVAVGSILISAAVGRIFFREKLSLLQLCGLAAGIGAVILLNL